MGRSTSTEHTAMPGLAAMYWVDPLNTECFLRGASRLFGAKGKNALNNERLSKTGKRVLIRRNSSFWRG